MYIFYDIYKTCPLWKSIQVNCQDFTLVKILTFFFFFFFHASHRLNAVFQRANRDIGIVVFEETFEIRVQGSSEDGPIFSAGDDSTLSANEIQQIAWDSIDAVYGNRNCIELKMQSCDSLIMTSITLSVEEEEPDYFVPSHSHLWDGGLNGI